MKILAVDTSSRTYSVALANGVRILGEHTALLDDTHSRHLMDAIARVMEDAGENLSSIDLLAVISGPGSFTGLRIGISTVLGLSFSLSRPVAGVSALRALAAGVPEQERPVWAVIDAKRAQVYTACYRRISGRLERVTDECAISPQQWLDTIHEDCVMAGDGALLYKQIIQERLGGKVSFAAGDVQVIQASVVARMLHERFSGVAPGVLPPLVPRYLRTSDAKIPQGMKNPQA